MSAVCAMCSSCFLLAISINASIRGSRTDDLRRRWQRETGLALLLERLCFSFEISKNRLEQARSVCRRELSTGIADRPVPRRAECLLQMSLAS